jgi:hypothetical protein
MDRAVAPGTLRKKEPCTGSANGQAEKGAASRMHAIAWDAC